MDNDQKNDQKAEEYVSAEGRAMLEKKLEELKSQKRLVIAERLEYAKSLGDLSENSEYQEAKEVQMVNEAEIAELEDFLSIAVTIKKPSGVSEISIGSAVIVSSSSLGRERYTIVGTQEANPASGRISNESPLARALLGRKRGEKVSVITPKGEIEYFIIDIA